MKMYTLILTIMLTTGWPDGGVSTEITYIDGFTSQDKCKVAGRLWLDNAKARHGKASRSALCVAK
jgi:hypothetical protein